LGFSAAIYSRLSNILNCPPPTISLFVVPHTVENRRSIIYHVFVSLAPLSLRVRNAEEWVVFSLWLYFTQLLIICRVRFCIPHRVNLMTQVGLLLLKHVVITASPLPRSEPPDHPSKSPADSYMKCIKVNTADTYMLCGAKWLMDTLDLNSEQSVKLRVTKAKANCSMTETRKPRRLKGEAHPLSAPRQ